MQLIALKKIYRIKPGDRFEQPDAVGRILILIGSARAADAPDETAVPRRRTYRRRDLHAEGE